MQLYRGQLIKAVIVQMNPAMRLELKKGAMFALQGKWLYLFTKGSKRGPGGMHEPIPLPKGVAAQLQRIAKSVDLRRLDQYVHAEFCHRG